MAGCSRIWIVAVFAALGCGDAERSASGTGGAQSGGGTAGEGVAGLTSFGGGTNGAASTGGTAGSAAAGASGGATERTPNAWSSEAVPLGVPGWRTSSEPFCDVHQGQVVGNALWADARGVFALVAESCIPQGRDLPSCTEQGRSLEGTTLSWNDGSGWKVLVDAPMYGDLTGFEGGALLAQNNDCPLLEADPDARSTRCALPGPIDPSTVRTFVVRPGLAYAVLERSLYGFIDGSWIELVTKTPERLNALWANDSRVYLAGDYGLYVYEPGADTELRPLPDAPAAKYLSAWGSSTDDVWFGNSAGQLTHFDGQGYTRIRAISSPYPDVSRLWGSGGVLYFGGWRTFGRIVNDEVETLIDGSKPDAPDIGSFWGTSASDVFLALSEPAFAGTPCGSALFLHFDGREFHRF